MLSTHLIECKEELATSIAALWQELERRTEEALQKELRTFATVDLWNDLLYLLMSRDFRAFYMTYLTKYGATRRADDEELPLIHKQFADQLHPTVQALHETFKEMVAKVSDMRRKETKASVLPHVKTLSDRYAQTICDHAKADADERCLYKEGQFALRLEQARTQQKQAEKRIKDLLQKARITHDTYAVNKEETHQINMNAHTSRQQVTLLKQQHVKSVDNATELYMKLDEARNQLIAQESAHTKQLCEQERRHKEEKKEKAAAHVCALEALQEELRATYAKLHSAVCQKREAEDISHHLDVLCEKLNLEVNWLLRVLRRSGTERKKVDTLQTELQKMHCTGATTLALCVSGGWKPGEAPDTAAPIQARHCTTLRVSPPNVPLYNTLVLQSEALKEILNTEHLHDTITKLEDSLREEEVLKRKLQMQLRHSVTQHDKNLRLLYASYSKEMDKVSSKAYVLQRKVFLQANKSVVGRRLQHGTRALDELSQRLASKDVQLNQVNIELWRLKRIIAAHEKRSGKLPPELSEASPASPPPPDMDVDVDVDVIKAEIAGLSSEELSLECSDAGSSVGNDDADVDDAGLLLLREEVAAVAAVVSVVSQCCVHAPAPPTATMPASTAPQTPFDMGGIDAKLWREADTEVQRISDLQLQAACAAHTLRSSSAQPTPHATPPAYPVKFTTAPFTARMAPRPPSASSASPRPTKTCLQREAKAATARSWQKAHSNASPVPETFPTPPPQRTIVTLPFKDAQAKVSTGYVSNMFSLGWYCVSRRCFASMTIPFLVLLTLTF